MKPTKFKHPLRWYAENYHVSIATVKRWSVKGYNLDDPKSINLQLLGQKHEPENFNPDPNNPRGIDQTCATVLHQHLERVEALTRIIARGQRVEGLTRKETIEGHVRLSAMMAEDLWKGTIMALSGKTLAEIKTILAEEDALEVEP